MEEAISRYRDCHFTRSLADPLLTLTVSIIDEALGLWNFTATNCIVGKNAHTVDKELSLPENFRDGPNLQRSTSTKGTTSESLIRCLASHSKCHRACWCPVAKLIKVYERANRLSSGIDIKYNVALNGYGTSVLYSYEFTELPLQHVNAKNQHC